MVSTQAQTQAERLSSGLAALCVELETMPAPLDRVAAGGVLTRADAEVVRVRERLQTEVGTAQVS